MLGNGGHPTISKVILSFILGCKLKALKNDIKTRDEQVFGNLEHQKKLFRMSYKAWKVWKRREHYEE